MDVFRRRLDWLLPSWLEDAGAYDQSIDEDMVTIGYTLLVNIIILFSCALFFSFYRMYDTQIFAPKCTLMPERCPPKLSNTTLFGWVSELFYTDDDTVIAKGGYDILFFLRFYRLAYKIFSVFAIYAWGILLPVNATGRGIVDNNNTFELWSMTNLKQGSDRCWFHLVGIYLLTIITIFFLEKEFVVYAKYRHAYLRQRHAHLRTVLVEGIPNKMRSTITLATYFETLYPNAVLSVRLGQVRLFRRALPSRPPVPPCGLTVAARRARLPGPALPRPPGGAARRRRHSPRALPVRGVPGPPPPHGARGLHGRGGGRDAVLLPRAQRAQRRGGEGAGGAPGCTIYMPFDVVPHRVCAAVWCGM